MFPSPPPSGEVEDVETEEAAVRAPSGQSPAVTPLVEDGQVVARGAAVACLRHAPDISFVSPIGGTVARSDMLPGRRLSEIVLFREPDAGVERHDTAGADNVAGLRALMQAAGVWPWIRRRPFGGMPAAGEVPDGIVVMAADTRPFAPDPVSALAGREEDFSRGLAALSRLTEGPVFVCIAEGQRLDFSGQGRRIRTMRGGARHPQGSAGIRVHALCPAGLDAPVWDIHAEDVASLGALLATGELPMMRQVTVAGAALREGRTVRTHFGADLRQLTQRIVDPGPHVLLTGSPLDGRQAHWLGQRDRQVTVLPRETGRQTRPHWLVAALTRSPVGHPAIPSAALGQALGGAIPAVPFIRALSSGDDETAMRLGVLSLLEEDLALADYVLSEGGRLTEELRAMLDRIETEFAA